MSRRRKRTGGDPRPPDKRPGIDWPTFAFLPPTFGPNPWGTVAGSGRGTLDLGLVRDDDPNWDNNIATAQWLALNGLDPAGGVAVVANPDPTQPDRLVAADDPAVDEDQRAAERRLRSYRIYPSPYARDEHQSYHDGLCDGYDDLDLSANPHELGTREHRDWTRGHITGQQIHREANGTMGATAEEKADALRWVPDADKLPDPVDEVLGGYEFVDRPKPLDAGRLLEHGWTEATTDEDLAVGDRVLLDPEGQPRIFTRTDPERIYRAIAGEEPCPFCGRFGCHVWTATLDPDRSPPPPLRAPRGPIRFITPPAVKVTPAGLSGAPLVGATPKVVTVDDFQLCGAVPDLVDAFGAVGQAAAAAVKPFAQALSSIGRALDMPPAMASTRPLCRPWPPELLDQEPQNRAQRRARASGRSFTCRRHGVQHGSFCRLCERDR